MITMPACDFEHNPTGIFADVPMDTYQAAPGLSKSRADTLHRSPLDFNRKLDNEVTAAMQRGTVQVSVVPRQAPRGVEYGFARES